MNKYLALALSLLLFSAASTAQAGIDPFLTFRGRIVDANNLPPRSSLAGLPVEVRLYAENADDESKALWGASYRVQVDTNGLFQIPLGLEEPGPYGTVDFVTNLVEGADLSAILQEGGAHFLGLKLGQGASEGYPRQRLLSVPFAAHAVSAEKLAQDTSVSTLYTTNLMADTVIIDNLDDVSSAAPITFAGEATFHLDELAIFTIPGLTPGSSSLTVPAPKDGFSVFSRGAPRTLSLVNVAVGDTIETPPLSGVATIVTDDWTAPGIVWFVEGGTPSTSPCPVSSGTYYFFEFGTAN